MKKTHLGGDVSLKEASVKIELGEDEMILEVRHFRPDIMELKKGEELILKKDSSVLALRTIIGKRSIHPADHSR